MNRENVHFHRRRVAIIGTGASTLYLLKNLLLRFDDVAPAIEQIVLFESGGRPGMGMPYHPATTDRFNFCNISSEEIPELLQSLADWLRLQSADSLARFDLHPDRIRDDETYARLAVGEYFEAQFHELVSALRGRGLAIRVQLNARVIDVRDDQVRRVLTLETSDGEETFERLVIATGHAFKRDDEPQHGYYASPWPIQKLLPERDAPMNFAVGTLGASLSAFDVVTSLAHRQGEFEVINADAHALRFVPRVDAPNFRIVMHTSNGWLPHLQYLQCRPFREVYRYVSREKLLALRDAKGRLRLDAFYNSVCRPVLIEAFMHDRRPDIAGKLRDDRFSLEALVETLSSEHTYDNAFAGMQREFDVAERKIERGEAVRWKESLDDLIYTLSYHAELMSAEDHQRLSKTVLPFLNSVIAAMPLMSAAVLLALRDAGRIDLIAGRAEVTDTRDGETAVTVAQDDESNSTHRYKMFVDCTGQSGLDLDTFPFRSLVEENVVCAATVRFADARRDGQPAMTLPGIAIDAAHRVIGVDGRPNERIFDIAFPHITGYRPYSYGLQACNHTAGLVIEAWKDEAITGQPPAAHPEKLTRLHDTVANES